jgi:hypothetical protein
LDRQNGGYGWANTIVHVPWSGLASLSIFLLASLSLAQVVGKLGEMDRLEQQSDDLAAQADPEGAALAIGKAAMMADLLMTEAQKPVDGEIFHAASLLYRAQELGFRALALFERTGGTPPAPVGVCQYLFQGHKKLEDSKNLLERFPSISPSLDEINVRREKLLQKNEEWKDLLLGLQNDFACSDTLKKTFINPQFQEVYSLYSLKTEKYVQNLSP